MNANAFLASFVGIIALVVFMALMHIAGTSQALSILP